jgi:hypothetical protein
MSASPANFIPTRPPWWDQAECNSDDGHLATLFFPDLHGLSRPGPDSTDDERDAYGEAHERMRVDEARAKEICAGCEVSERCLIDAVRRGERFGIWGGFNFAVRRQNDAARQQVALMVTAA